MISEALLEIVRCPDCRGLLRRQDATLGCEGCARRFDSTPGYLDLRPLEQYSERTKYLDDELHADSRHETVSPPLLSAGVRNGMLRRLLRPGRGDRVVDLGCGSGRAIVWNRDLGAWTAGVDVSPFFAREALETSDLALADLRKLPFADATFTKAYSLDVLEHLSPEALGLMLREAGRVLVPGGAFFVYSHVRKNGPLAGGLRAINRLARLLERLDLIDMAQERLRKSDHQNPLADLDELTRVASAAGFHLATIRFYTPLLGGFIENILVRMVEHAMVRRVPPGGSPDGSGVPAPSREVRTRAKSRIARRGFVYAGLAGLTQLMKLDVLAFGRIRSGPFFAVLIKDEGPRVRP